MWGGLMRRRGFFFGLALNHQLLMPRLPSLAGRQRSGCGGEPQPSPSCAALPPRSAAALQHLAWISRRSRKHPRPASIHHSPPRTEQSLRRRPAPLSLRRSSPGAEAAPRGSSWGTRTGQGCSGQSPRGLHRGETSSTSTTSERQTPNTAHLVFLRLRTGGRENFTSLLQTAPGSAARPRHRAPPARGGGSSARPPGTPAQHAPAEGSRGSRRWELTTCKADQGETCSNLLSSSRSRARRSRALRISPQRERFEGSPRSAGAHHPAAASRGRSHGRGVETFPCHLLRWPGG